MLFSLFFFSKKKKIDKLNEAIANNIIHAHLAQNESNQNQCIAK